MQMINRFRMFLILGCSLAAYYPISLCGQGVVNKPVDLAFESEFSDHFLNAYWSINPDYAIYEGYYKNAEMTVIPDDKSRAQLEKFIIDWENKLHAYDPNSLNSSNQSDWAVIDLDLRTNLWKLKTLKEWEWNPAEYNIAGPISRLMESNYAPLEHRLRIIFTRLKAASAYYSAAKKSIFNPSRVHTDLALVQSQGTLTLIGTELESKLRQSRLDREEIKTDLLTLIQARAAVVDYITYLKEIKVKLGDTGGRSFRLGSVLYNEKFNFENPGSSGAEALYRYALSEKDSVLSKMNALSDELWFLYFKNKPKPKDRLVKIAQTIDIVSKQHSAPKDYVHNLRVLLSDLSEYVKTNKLVELDPRLPIGVREMPAYERGISFGNAESPGPYDATAAGYFNIIPPETYPAEKVDSLLREYNSWTTQIFTIHEAMPGHLVQLQHANKSPSKIRAVFSNSTMIEGWAVYSERMMLESGWGHNSPELMLMYWKWYLRSVLNTIVDHDVHVGNRSEAYVKALIVNEGFQSEEEASIKWRRAELSSVQLTCYFSGFSQIYHFRDTWKKEQGERYNVENFNEAFLSYGSVPVGTIINLMNHNHD